MKRKNSRNIILLSFVLFLFIPAGCKKKEEAPPQPAPKEKVAPKPTPTVQRQQTSAHLRPVPSQTGMAAATKDPFKPYVVETKPAKPIFRRGSRIGSLPIQNYEVSQFKVLGIVAGLKENSALVVDPAGKAYVVKPGMEIGKNGGQVRSITAASIDVLERYQDEGGRIKKRTVRLALPRKD